MEGLSISARDVDYAITQALNLYQRGQKHLAVRTYTQLLGVRENPLFAGDIRGLYYSADHRSIDDFEAHLKLFARNHIPGYTHQ